MSDKSQVKVYLPEELHSILNGDTRANSEAVEAALWREYGGAKRSAIEQRIKEKKDRITILQQEIATREEELEEERRELHALEAKLNDRSSAAEEVRDAIEALPDEKVSVDNTAVKHQAEKVDMEPSELLRELGYEVDD